MSMARCDDCDAVFDTDADPDCFIDTSPRTTIIRCLYCREDAEALAKSAERGEKWRRDVLAVDLFAGDKCGVELWLRDKIVIARKAGECRECEGPIAPGTLVRSMAFKDDGEIISGRVCQDCCDAAAISWEDNGDALVERYGLLCDRRDARAALAKALTGSADGASVREAHKETTPHATSPAVDEAHGRQTEPPRKP